MKFELFCFSLLLSCTINGLSKTAININPTGTYKLDIKTIKKGDDIYGYSGEIKVKRINDTKLVLTLFVSKGAPSYNSGTIWDTLEYKNNKIIYLPTEDSTCRIVFTFKANGVYVEQRQANPNFGCGFGHAVFADGYYKKVSSKIPLIKDPAEE